MIMFIYSPHVSAGNYSHHRAVLQREAPTSVLSFYLKCHNQWRTQEFFSGGGGVQQIQLRTERMGIWGR